MVPREKTTETLQKATPAVAGVQGSIQIANMYEFFNCPAAGRGPSAEARLVPALQWKRSRLRTKSQHLSRWDANAAALNSNFRRLPPPGGKRPGQHLPPGRFCHALKKGHRD